MYVVERGGTFQTEYVRTKYNIFHGTNRSSIQGRVVPPQLALVAPDDHTCPLGMLPYLNSTGRLFPPMPVSQGPRMHARPVMHDSYRIPSRKPGTESEGGQRSGTTPAHNVSLFPGDPCYVAEGTETGERGVWTS